MSEEISKKYGTASGGESYQLQTQGKINDAQKARKLEPKILVEIRMIDPEGKRVLGYVAADDPVMFEVQMTIEFEGRRYGLSKHYASLADWTGERLNFHVDNDIKQMVELLYALPCYPAYPEKP